MSYTRYWSTKPTTVPAGSDHYFTECPSVRPKTSKSSDNHCRPGLWAGQVDHWWLLSCGYSFKCSRGTFLDLLPSNLFIYKTCVPSLIHSARSAVPPIEITILTWSMFCFAIFWKLERTSGRQDGRTDTTFENSDHYQHWL